MRVEFTINCFGTYQVIENLLITCVTRYTAPPIIENNIKQDLKIFFQSQLVVVRTERLELSHLAILEPKSSASTNSATSALVRFITDRLYLMNGIYQIAYER